MSGPQQAEHSMALQHELRAQLFDVGFDLCASFVVASQLPGVDFHFERLGFEQPLGVVVGNTKRLWPHFTRWRELTRFQGLRPLDHYVQIQVSAAVARALACVGLPPRWSAYFSHRMDYSLCDGARVGPVPIQRLAHLAGLASLSPAHLSVHPRVGPWLALRAVLVLPCEGSPSSAPREQPCGGCRDRPCEGALARALAPRLDGEPLSARWIAVRDACPVGRKWRYDTPQLRFHYAALDRGARRNSS